MQYVAGAATFIFFATLAYIYAGSPLLSVALVFIGVVLCGFAAAGRHEGAKGDPA